MPSLLVTNDFPPKHGGIQSYLYELWRRLPPGETTVLTTPFPGAAEWDARAGVPRRARARRRCCCRRAALARRIDALAREVGADVIFLDPMLPLGLVGPRLTAAPYVVVAHGGEITGYARTAREPRSSARRVMRGAAAVVAAGAYPARAATACRRARRCAGVVIPPGVDGERFRPLDADAARRDPRAGSVSIPTGRSCSASRASCPARASTS